MNILIRGIIKVITIPLIGITALLAVHNGIADAPTLLGSIDIRDLSLLGPPILGEWEGPTLPDPSESPETGHYIEIIATAYSIKGKMKNGKQTHSGAISVDPNFIPMGTTGYIEGIGPVTAEDTGRLIKGNVVDIWMETEQQALDWGRRRVKLWITN